MCIYLNDFYKLIKKQNNLSMFLKIYNNKRFNINENNYLMCFSHYIFYSCENNVTKITTIH